MKTNRRRFLVQAGLAGAGMIHLRFIPLHAAAGTPPEAPESRFDDADQDALHGAAFRHALRNLLVTNTVLDTKRECNRTGLFTDPPGRFIRAGGDYHTPWTRDASINSWNAASLLSPAVARNTLWAVCELQANGKLIIQRDNLMNCSRDRQCCAMALTITPSLMSAAAS